MYKDAGLTATDIVVTALAALGRDEGVSAIASETA
jgi:hypothetical protein